MIDGLMDPRAWLVEKAAPRWVELGIDQAYGGFFETVDAHTGTSAGEIKRLRTVCRQIFAFCESGKLGFAPADEVIEHGVDFLLRYHSREDGAFRERVTRSGKPVNENVALYDLAFALFALAKAYEVTRSARLRSAALAMIAFIETRLKDQSWGFVERLPVAGDREQNPHMHLLEAVLAWLDVDPDMPVRTMAQSLLTTFDRYIFVPQLGILSEFPQARDGTLAQVHRIEPGHHFEWIWLLDWSARHGLVVPGASAALEEKALAAGLSSVGVPYGALVVPGDHVIEDSCRIWQACEWTRAAALDLLEKNLGDDARSVRLLSRFLDFPIEGFWYERCRCDDGTMITEPVKATSFYHVIGAVCALIDRSNRGASDADAMSPEPTI